MWIDGEDETPYKATQRIVGALPSCSQSEGATHRLFSFSVDKGGYPDYRLRSLRNLTFTASG